jgi:hypothetical protein
MNKEKEKKKKEKRISFCSVLKRKKVKRRKEEKKKREKERRKKKHTNERVELISEDRNKRRISDMVRIKTRKAFTATICSITGTMLNTSDQSTRPTQAFFLGGSSCSISSSWILR